MSQRIGVLKAGIEPAYDSSTFTIRSLLLIDGETRDGANLLLWGADISTWAHGEIVATQRECDPHTTGDCQKRGVYCTLLGLQVRVEVKPTP